MNPVIGFCVAAQLLLLIWVVRRLKGRALGTIGFLFLAASFVYHGLTEIVQSLFPNRDIYRQLTDEDAVASWLILCTAAMSLYTAAYLYSFRVAPVRLRASEMLSHLTGSLILKWQVLLAISVSTFLLLALQQDNALTYWVAGLTDQFSSFLLGLTFATLGLKLGGKRFFLLTCVFAVFLSASGSRTMVLSSTVVAVAAMVRYGIRLRMRELIGTAALVLFAFIAISASRNTYGRFESGETFSQRLDAIFSVNTVSTDQLLDDVVYRFDANSFGALLLDRQDRGYGTTGLAQVISTARYMIPSFIFKSKLDLDEEQRNEESYTTNFFGLPENIDYTPDLWSLLLGYIGKLGVLVLAPLLGLLTAQLDNWLDQRANITSYLLGVGASTITMHTENGFAGVLYILRGLLVLLVVARMTQYVRFMRAKSTAAKASVLSGFA